MGISNVFQKLKILLLVVLCLVSCKDKKEIVLNSPEQGKHIFLEEGLNLVIKKIRLTPTEKLTFNNSGKGIPTIYENYIQGDRFKFEIEYRDSRVEIREVSTQEKVIIFRIKNKTLEITYSKNAPEK